MEADGAEDIFWVLGGEVEEFDGGGPDFPAEAEEGAGDAVFGGLLAGEGFACLKFFFEALADILHKFLICLGGPIVFPVLEFDFDELGFVEVEVDLLEGDAWEALDLPDFAGVWEGLAFDDFGGGTEEGFFEMDGGFSPMEAEGGSEFVVGGEGKDGEEAEEKGEESGV